MAYFPTAFGRSITQKDAFSSSSVYQTLESANAVDLYLVPARFDYTSAFDALTYNKEAVNTRFRPSENAYTSALQKKTEDFATTNTQLLLLVYQQRDALAQSRRENECLQELIHDLKNEHFLDFYAVIDACKENFIPTEENGWQTNLRTLLALLLQHYRTDNIVFRDDKIIYRCKEAPLLQMQIYDRDDQILHLKQKYSILERYITADEMYIASLRYQIDVLQKAAKEAELLLLQYCHSNASAELKFNELALESALNATRKEEIRRFYLFSNALFRLAEILQIEPNLSIDEVIGAIHREVIRLKAGKQLQYTRDGDNGAPFENVMQLSTRRLLHDVKAPYKSDDFVSYVENVLYMQSLADNAAVVENLYYQAEIGDIFELIDKIQCGMRFSGDRKEVLEQTWQYLLDY